MVSERQRSVETHKNGLRPGVDNRWLEKKKKKRHFSGFTRDSPRVAILKIHGSLNFIRVLHMRHFIFGIV